MNMLLVEDDKLLNHHLTTLLAEVQHQVHSTDRAQVALPPSTLATPQDYLNQLYLQHKRKNSLWELICQKLPYVIITASGVQFRAGTVS